MIAGKCQRVEFEYARHGTLCLIGNLVVTTGALLRPTIGPTRTESDFASHIEQTMATDPKGSWVFVVDTLNIHCSESLVTLVADACEVATDLGTKERRGAEVGGEPASVRVEVEPPDSVRVSAEAQLVAEPDRGGVRGDHAEGDPARLVQLGGGFATKLLTFIADFNRVFAKPFRWTYTGRPLMKAAA